MGFELGGYQGQHILAAFEKGTSRAVVDARLGLVEGLEGILLGSLAIARMGLQEARVRKQEQRLGETRGLVVVGCRSGVGKDSGQADCKAKNAGDASKDDFGIHIMG